MFKTSLITLGALTALVVARPQTGPEARRAANGQEFVVDSQHSNVLFRVQHLKAAPFYGRFNQVEGRFKIDADEVSNSFVEITIPVDSIDTNDEGRDKHLKSGDFFAAKEFPTIKLQSAKVEKAGDDRYRVTADLTLRGETKQITFEAVHTGTANLNPRFGLRTGYEVKFEIDRTDFGMDFYAEHGVLGTKVQVIVAIEGKLPK